MIIVSDVIDQVGRVLGTCDPTYTFRRTVATITLNNILTLGDPLAVIGLVILRMVNSSEDTIRPWTRASHIPQEIGEAIFPSSADPDATSSVPLIVTVIRVIAARFHVYPDTIFFTRPIAASCVSMGARNDSARRRSVASATTGATRSEALTIHRFFHATVTPTPPTWLSPFAPGPFKAQDHPQPKTLASQIDSHCF
jgi:hypothetical protein